MMRDLSDSDGTAAPVRMRVCRIMLTRGEHCQGGEGVGNYELGDEENFCICLPAGSGMFRGCARSHDIAEKQEYVGE